MSDALISALVGAIVGGAIGLIGVRYAAARNERTLRWLREEDRQEHKDRVLASLHAEIEHNRDLLKALWKKTTQNLGGPDGNNQREFNLRAHFIAEPIPHWGQLMFESQAGYLRGDVVRRVYEEYADLNKLAELHSRIEAMMPAQLVSKLARWTANYPQGNVPSIGEMPWHGDYIRFIRETQELWTEASGIINGILSSPNPVPETDLPTQTLIPTATPWWSRR